MNEPIKNSPGQIISSDMNEDTSVLDTSAQHGTTLLIKISQTGNTTNSSYPDENTDDTTAAFRAEVDSGNDLATDTEKGDETIKNTRVRGDDTSISAGVDGKISIYGRSTDMTSEGDQTFDGCNIEQGDAMYLTVLGSQAERKATKVYEHYVSTYGEYFTIMIYLYIMFFLQAFVHNMVILF